VAGIHSVPVCGGSRGGTSDEKGGAMTRALMQSDLLFYSLVYLLVVFAVGFFVACLESSLKNWEEESDDPR
jgi:hypothetical protein